MVVLAVARKAGEAGGVEPLEVFREPFLDGGEVGLGEGFGVGEEGKGLNDFRECTASTTPSGRPFSLVEWSVHKGGSGSCGSRGR